MVTSRAVVGSLAISRAGLQARFLGGFCRHMACQVRHHTGLAQLIRAAEKAALGFIDGAVLPVQGPESRLSQELVNDVISGELGGDVGGTGKELVGFGVDLRLVILHPEDLSCHIVGADGVTEPLNDAIFPEMFRQPFDLSLASGVDAVKDGLPERTAVLIHRQAVTS